MIFGFNPEKIRQDFPVLTKPVIYFDNACMSLKPRQVVDKMNWYYNECTACAGRSSHRFAQEVGIKEEEARESIKSLVNAKQKEEIVFTKNTTESINLVANGLSLKQGDEVIISDKEHNSNLIPWLKLKEKGIILKVTNSNEDNTFNIENLNKNLTNKTKLVSIVHTSNLDGATNPIKEISKMTHDNNSLLLVDGAQSIPHKEIDVRTLGADFFAFSGHKMLGPTGTGALYGRKDLLEGLDQFIVGGETVLDSTYESYVKEYVPNKFEAGLQNYAGNIGFGEAARYLKRIGLDNIEKHELKLNKILTEGLQKEKKITLLGPNVENRSGIFSFNIEGMNPHHVSGILDNSEGILIRSGQHCVHSWFNKHKLKGSARASLYFYNTEDEARRFVKAVKKMTSM